MSEFIPLELSGLYARSVPKFEDERGYFQELSRHSALISICPVMIQDNISYSTGNVLRGMHFQENQWQILTVLKGSILDVTIDISPESDTYLKSCAVELGESGIDQLILPPNLAHGFCTLSDEVILLYKSSKYYGETPQHGVAWDSEQIVELWPKNNWVISPRDLTFPTLNEFQNEIK